jgi:hypothetical protein
LYKQHHLYKENKMTTITTRQTNTFPEAKTKFLAKAERLVQGYDKMPSPTLKTLEVF